ncbi:hypothetical protein D6B98_24680 [Bradyrhizobium sp. LVM 105]|nr:hypothetical protein D6B98_24680 [Bradyrhizobium sp. LVM 105]
MTLGRLPQTARLPERNRCIEVARSHQLGIAGQHIRIEGFLASTQGVGQAVVFREIELEGAVGPEPSGLLERRHAW